MSGIPSTMHSSMGRRSPAGAILSYSLEPTVTETLLGLIQAERSCCPSLSIEATVTVCVQAPEEVRAWVTDTFVHGSGEPSDVGIEMLDRR